MNRKSFIMILLAVALFIFLLPTMQSCKKLDFEKVVRIKTGEVSNVTSHSASITGFVQDVGERWITQYGHCWSTNEEPTTTLETKTVNGTKFIAGSFQSDLTDLAPDVTYYVRAYATNSQGTVYGDEVEFSTTHETGTFIDSRDNHTYTYVQIDDQVWMAENLAYLPSVNPPSSDSDTEPYYYVYNYEGTAISAAKTLANYATYGVLYNWPAAVNACPSGWHLPSDGEWKQLEVNLGMSLTDSDASSWRGTDEGGKLKETGTLHWESPNEGATNSSGFTALPGGNREYGGYFDDIGQLGEWWTATEKYGTQAWIRELSYNYSEISRSDHLKKYGLSVRCMKNVTYSAPVAAFTASTTTITAGQSVHFTDQSTNIPTSWSWSFGDGGTSSAQNPSHTYTTAGTYSVILTTTNSFGSDSLTKTNYITVAEGTGSGTLTDSRDGKIYNWVQIGDQIWMAENLAYLPSVSPPSSESDTEPYYYVYGYFGINVSEAKATGNYATYGVLYNWPAAMNSAVSSSANPSGVQGACPSGWHLPSDAEWTELTDYLGGESIAGGKLKEVGTSHWQSPNTDATNESGFTALPGGLSDYLFDDFDDVGYNGYWWSATESYTSYAYDRELDYYFADVDSRSTNKEDGYSVRCVKDTVDAAPVAEFTASPTTITAGQSIQFTDQSSNSPTSWSWDFGDGGTSTAQNPSHAYATAGAYTIKLTVSNNDGSDSETKEDFITVNPTGCIPVLISPLETDTLDNGCVSLSDPIEWYFDWDDCEGATKYDLRITWQSGAYTDDETSISELNRIWTAYIPDSSRIGKIKYKVRAFINGAWGDWSSERTINVEPVDTDCPPQIVTDIDGNVYNKVKIGNQWWMAENLKTTKYNDGTAIPLETDEILWRQLETPAYSWRLNDSATYKATYGAYYNWFVVSITINGGKNVCPSGWHVPNDTEWTTLIDYLGGESVAGGKLKETSNTHWNDPNTGATNESGFTALPGGYREGVTYGLWDPLGIYGNWWSTTEYSSQDAGQLTLFYNDSKALISYDNKNHGFNIRCIED